MALFGLTPAGFRVKQFGEIVEELGISFRAGLGPELDLDPETSIAGQVINSFAERESLIWDNMGATHGAAYPSSAEGVSLDGVSDITLVGRLGALKSSVTGRCLGDPGTLIPAGRIASVQETEARFVSLADGTILPDGTVDIVFESQEDGPIAAPATTLTIIETTVPGWDSVSNAADADLGRNIENDTDYRIRRRDSLQVIGAAANEAVRARILNEVPGVTDVVLKENDDDVPVDGIPPHSFQPIVAGGEDVAIADKIFETRSMGIRSFGTDVTEVVVDSKGFPHTIKFDRAGKRLAWLHIQIEVGAFFTQGASQRERIVVSANAPGDNVTIRINGRDFDAVAGASEADTVTALITAIQGGGADWVPVTATVDGGDPDALFLDSDYVGNPFGVTTSSDGATTLTISSIIESSGDPSSVIQNVVDFAEGTDELPVEQTIGEDVYRSRYFTPINEVADIQTINIWTANGLGAFWPTSAPIAGGDWSAADIAVLSTEFAEFDTLRVTIEIV